MTSNAGQVALDPGDPASLVVSPLAPEHLTDLVLELRISSKSNAPIPAGVALAVSTDDACAPALLNVARAGRYSRLGFP